MAFRNKSVDVHQFAMNPSAEIPRSQFRMQTARKAPFDSGMLVPMFLTEVLPGDTFRMNMTALVRLATPIFPFMDNLWFDTFWFYVPARLTWAKWARFMGEQINPGDSISFTIPQVQCTAGGNAVGSLQDHMGLPVAGQIAGANILSVSALPFRAYNLIFNEWFRDENLINSQPTNTTSDGPDNIADYVLCRRMKRPDYFTGCLPWPQKGNTAVTIPLGTSATVKTQASPLFTGVQAPAQWLMGGTGTAPANNTVTMNAGGMFSTVTAAGILGGSTAFYPTNLFADLTTATAATINSLRLAFQTQRFLEREARGGSRYTEMIWSHFKVKSPDARLQRPEYLGGGSTPINVNPVAQTSNTPVSGTPQGNLSAFASGVCRSGFSQSFVEHGYVIGLMNVRADLNYQQGLHKMWTRLTRFDFYLPVFANLGEQAVQVREIYCDGSANDTLVFGYQERWAEYRYLPPQIVGLFRSTAVGTIDPWHLAQRFTGFPALNSTFIIENPPISRVVAVGAGANGQQLLADMFFDVVAARPMPLYSVPGMIDHF